MKKVILTSLLLTAGLLATENQNGAMHKYGATSGGQESQNLYQNRNQHQYQYDTENSNQGQQKQMRLRDGSGGGMMHRGGGKGRH